MMLSLRNRDLVCQQAIELLTDYLEGTLSEAAAAARGPPPGMPNCSNYLEQIRITIKLTGAIEPEELPPTAVDDLTQLYKRWRGEA